MRIAAIAVLGALPFAAWADPAVVEAVDVAPGAQGWRVSVTLSHGDTGWDDYADGWRVVDANGEVLGLRELLHPHVNEQPFTRSLSGVSIPEGLSKVFVEARTNTDGWGAERFVVDLPGR